MLIWSRLTIRQYIFQFSIEKFANYHFYSSNLYLAKAQTSVSIKIILHNTTLKKKFNPKSNLSQTLKNFSSTKNYSQLILLYKINKKANDIKLGKYP